MFSNRNKKWKLKPFIIYFVKTESNRYKKTYDAQPTLMYLWLILISLGTVEVLLFLLWWASLIHSSHQFSPNSIQFPIEAHPTHPQNGSPVVQATLKLKCCTSNRICSELDYKQQLPNKSFKGDNIWHHLWNNVMMHILYCWTI